MAYESGTLDQRITLQIKVITLDAFGAEQTAWQDVRTCWAALHPMRGKEYLAVDHLRASLDCKFVLRANACTDIDVEARIVHKGQIYGIAAKIDIRSEGHWVELMCTAGVAQS